MLWRKINVLFASTLAVSACATSVTVIGTPRSAIDATAVRVYLEPISRQYQEIAVIDASSKRAWSFTADAKTEVVVARLTVAAARLGANGLLLQEISDGTPGSFATGVGTDRFNNHGNVSLGIGWLGPSAAKYGRAIAVYVEPD